MTKMTNKIKNDKMVEISKSDLSTLLECVYTLRDIINRQDDNANAYNMIEDGSIDSPTFDEEGYHQLACKHGTVLVWAS